ncbi:MAG: hypothetical protein ABIG95_01805 [Candidatus Woesearchaeota archaeon]
MRKVHTRMKRMHGVSTHQAAQFIRHRTHRKVRPKTFGTEASAKAWAAANKITKYTLKKVKRNKRFQIES